MHVLGLVADEEISVETPHRRTAPGTGRGRDVEHNRIIGHRGHGGVDVGRHELGRRVLLPDSRVGSDVSTHRRAPHLLSPPAAWHRPVSPGRWRRHTSGSGSDGWRIEPLLAQLFGYRRLATHDERCADLYGGFLPLAAALTGHQRLATSDTLLRGSRALGRPPNLPRMRAALSPAWVRSRTRSRSNASSTKT